MFFFLFDLFPFKFPCANPFAFAFAHFSGIFFTSTIILLVYCIVKKNKPFVVKTRKFACACSSFWIKKKKILFENRNVAQSSQDSLLELFGPLRNAPGLLQTSN